MPLAKSKIKVQSIVDGKAADIYRLIPRGVKNAAIVHALLLLAKDKEHRELFFGQNQDMVEKILNGESIDNSAKENSKQIKKSNMKDIW